METIVLFALMGLFVMIGVPIAVALILSSWISIAHSGLPINVISERLLSSINSYTLMAVPFFIAAAVMMNRSGVTRHILDLSHCLLGHRAGGLAKVNVLSSLFFSGMSGSATADVASQGRILIPRMKEEGYDAPFSAGVTAAASIMSSVIPPSIMLIIYGAVTNVSIGALFFAGIIPGFLLFFLYLLVVHLLSIWRSYPAGERMSWKETWPIFLKASPALLMPIIILGGIRFGVVTPTEAGVLACVYGLFLGLVVYREMDFRSLLQALEQSAVATAVPMFIIASSASFGFALSVTGFGFVLENFLTGLTDSPYIFMMIVLIFLFVVGLFLESTSALLIFVPLISPIAKSFGIPDVQFGIVVIVILMLGTLSPPIGLQSFIACHIAGIGIMRVDIWYFLFAILVVTLACIFFAPLTTYLPALLM